MLVFENSLAAMVIQQLVFLSHSPKRSNADPES